MNANLGARTILYQSRAQTRFDSPAWNFLARALKHLYDVEDKEYQRRDQAEHAILRQSDSLWHRLVEYWKH